MLRSLDVSGQSFNIRQRRYFIVGVRPKCINIIAIDH